jgi:hypothetical protein
VYEALSYTPQLKHATDALKSLSLSLFSLSLARALSSLSHTAYAAHTSCFIPIRQHTSAYVIRQTNSARSLSLSLTLTRVRALSDLIRHAACSYVSIRQHTSAYALALAHARARTLRPHTPCRMLIRNTSAYAGVLTYADVY